MLNEFVHNSRAAADGRLVDLDRRTVPQRLMGPLRVVELEILRQAQVQPWHVDVPFQVHILVLDATPEPFYKDIIQCPAATIHADCDVMRNEYPGESIARELAPLISVENV